MIMIEINIKSEKYYNADAPQITEEMKDWLFLTMHRSVVWDGIKKLKSIDIIANTAYNGSPTIHFYITINKKKDNLIHREYHINSPTSLQNPSLGHYFQGVHEPELNWLGEPKERSEWLAEIVHLKGVDCGEDGIEAMKRKDAMRTECERRDEIKKEEESRKHRYEQYLKLKKEFE